MARTVDAVNARMVPVVAIMASAALLSACASGSSGGGDIGGSDTQGQSKPVVNNGPGNGFKLTDCGGITDAEVIAAVGNPMLKRDVDSPLGCRWSTGPGTNDTSISLYWYRGSSAEKEAAVATNLGHTVQRVTTSSFPGYEVSNTGLCERSAGSGPDFLHWSLQSQTARTDPCKAVSDLMELLLSRVGKQ